MDYTVLHARRLYSLYKHIRKEKVLAISVVPYDLNYGTNKMFVLPRD
jgi:hypothetical protein